MNQGTNLTHKTIAAWSRVTNNPDECYRFRTYIVDENNVEHFNTSPRNCYERVETVVSVWNGEFNGLRVKARFRAFDRNNNQILLIDSPLVASVF